MPDLDQLDPLPKIIFELGLTGSEVVKSDWKQKITTAQQFKNLMFAFKAWVEAVDIDDAQKCDFMNEGKFLIDQVLKKESATYLEQKKLTMLP